MKPFELWIKPPLGVMEVESRHVTRIQAEEALSVIRLRHPDWSSWIETSSSREKFRDLGQETCPEYFD